MTYVYMLDNLHCSNFAKKKSLKIQNRVPSERLHQLMISYLSTYPFFSYFISSHLIS